MRFAISSLLFLFACAADVDDGGKGPDNGNPSDPNTGGTPPDNGGNPPGGSIGAGEFLTAIGHKECDDAFTCKASFPTNQGVTFAEAFGADKNACYGMASQYYNAAAVQAAITAGKIQYDGAAAKTCVDGLTAAPTCGTYWTEGPDMPAACDTAMVGKVAVGGACTIDFECAGENWCDDMTNKCAAIPQGARTDPGDGYTTPYAKLAARR